MTADVDRTGADTPVTGQRQPPRLWVPADGGVSPSEEAALASTKTMVSRRTMLKVGAAAGAGGAPPLPGAAGGLTGRCPVRLPHHAGAIIGADQPVD